MHTHLLTKETFYIFPEAFSLFVCVHAWNWLLYSLNQEMDTAVWYLGDLWHHPNTIMTTCKIAVLFSKSKRQLISKWPWVRIGKLDICLVFLQNEPRWIRVLDNAGASYIQWSAALDGVRWITVIRYTLVDVLMKALPSEKEARTIKKKKCRHCNVLLLMYNRLFSCPFSYS